MNKTSYENIILILEDAATVEKQEAEDFNSMLTQLTQSLNGTEYEISPRYSISGTNEVLCRLGLPYSLDYYVDRGESNLYIQDNAIPTFKVKRHALEDDDDRTNLKLILNAISRSYACLADSFAAPTFTAFRKIFSIVYDYAYGPFRRREKNEFYEFHEINALMQAHRIPFFCYKYDYDLDNPTYSIREVNW